MEVVSLTPIPSHAKSERRFMLLCAGGSEHETKHQYGRSPSLISRPLPGLKCYTKTGGLDEATATFFWGRGYIKFIWRCDYIPLGTRLAVS